MPEVTRQLAFAAAALALAACATVSTPKPVSQAEPRRIVGMDNDVRIDAEITADELQRSMTLPVRYDITNGRQAAIAIADILPETTFDPATGTVTITLGSEVPGNMFLPRLVAIAPGEKKSFTTAARINLMIPQDTRAMKVPSAIQIKVNFLDETATFAQLIGIPERGVYDPKLADEMFPKWVERNETVLTNTLPMRWAAPVDEPAAPASRREKRTGPG